MIDLIIIIQYCDKSPLDWTDSVCLGICNLYGEWQSHFSFGTEEPSLNLIQRLGWKFTIHRPTVYNSNIISNAAWREFFGAWTPPPPPPPNPHTIFQKDGQRFFFFFGANPEMWKPPWRLVKEILNVIHKIYLMPDVKIFMAKTFKLYP